MLIKKSNANKFENSKNCVVWEYKFPSKNFSYATALIDGRYPEQKRMANLECEEIYFVISGHGIVHSEKGDFKTNGGDLYFFEKGEAYGIEGTQLFIALTNVPKWTPEQYKIVD
ncbi:MAG: hypothetical protein ABFQ65_03655 [Nanoarchaeota archaeon]